MSSVAHLVEFHEKFGPQGFVILAISNEAKSTLEKFVKDKRVTYRVGVDEGGDVWGAYQGSGVPRSWLIDPDGIIVWKGHPGNLDESMLQEPLRKAQEAKLRDVVPALASAKVDIEKKKLGDAWGKAQKVLANDKAPEADRADAQYLVEEVKKRAEAALAAAEQLASSRQYPKAIQKLKDVAAQLKGTEWEKAATEKRKALEADPEAKRELEAQAVLDKLIAQEKALKKDKDRKKFMSNYLSFVKKYAGTQAAIAAQRRIDAINELRD